MYLLFLLFTPGLDQSWVMASEFEAKLKMAENGKDSQTRDCSTRRNRARMEKSNRLGLMVPPSHSAIVAAPHALTPLLAAAGSLVSSPLAQGSRALSPRPF